MGQKRYIVVNDNGDDYLIREEDLGKWNDFIGSEEYELGSYPDWMISIQGTLSFTDPSINGEPVEILKQ